MTVSAANASAPGNPNGLGKDDFLKLLVTQLSHQNPLNPLDSSAFVAQLAQFSSLEQLAQINVRLDTISMGQAGLIAGQSVTLVGRTVVFPGDQLSLDKGPAAYRYDLSQPAAKVELVIKDANGKVVRHIEVGGQGAGTQKGSWDGMDDDGNALPPGSYHLAVNAVDASGNPITAKTYGIGKVTGVSFTNGFPEIMVNETRVKSADIVEVLD